MKFQVGQAYRCKLWTGNVVKAVVKARTMGNQAIFDVSINGWQDRGLIKATEDGIEYVEGSLGIISAIA